MSGIACAGNWIVDHIKMIDCWPEQGALSNITATDQGIGGSAANVATDLRNLRLPAPVVPIGCIGDDDYGRFILAHCAAHQIDTSLIRVLPDQLTSYTDVMTIAETGHRTFFHHRGANAVFGPEHVDLDRLMESPPRIFHLGYLLLLDGMDADDPEYGTAAARLLHDVRAAGIQTSIDVVSEARDRFRKIVGPSLPHVDHCIINEYEAERITGICVRDGGLSRSALSRAAAALMELGVRETVVIHCPEGGLWLGADGREVWVPSLSLPDGFIVSAVGAGDAFCAGVLFGLHEAWPAEKCLIAAHGAAATCLQARNTTDGVRPLEEVLALADEYGT